MTDYVLDASWARNGWAAVKSVGFTGVSLYLSNDASKDCTPLDVEFVRKAGLDLMLNWESTTGRPKQGAAAGRTDRDRANQLADSLGYPKDCAIYYSCDTNATPGEVQAYYQACAGLRPVGAYGGADVVAHLLAAGITQYAWVANAGLWDHGVSDAGCHLHQHYHTRNVLPTPSGWPLNSYDESVVLRPDYGQWKVNADEMTPDQAGQLQRVHDLFFGGVGGGAQHKTSMIHDIENIVLDIQKRQKAAVAAAGGVLDAHAIAVAVADLLAARLVS